MKRALTLLVLLLIVLVMACSAEQPATTESAPKPATPAPPTAQQARDLIAGSAEFSEHEFTNAGWTTPVAHSSMSAPVQIEARDLAAAGWIELDEKGDVALSPRSRYDKRFLLRPNGLLDVVPLAKKEMGDVLAVRKNPDGTTGVDFNWKWIPNEVGTAFRTGPVHDRFAVPHESRATLIWDGTNWTVLKIEKR
jgi:hypothetical protein